MAAPVGNNFWELRSKHGRDRIFASPEILWESACEYFQWCIDNPHQIAEQRKGALIIPKDFEGDLGELTSSLVHIPQQRPFTIHGLCIFLGCHTKYFAEFKADLKSKDCKLETSIAVDFSNIVSRIEEIIYNQKFDGAASGFFNPNIIARDLGLRDKTELSTPPDGEGKFEVTLNIT